MGNEVFNEDHPYQYLVFKGEKKPGESQILVHPHGLTKKNYIDRYAQIECIEYYKEKIPDTNFLDTREYNPLTKNMENMYGNPGHKFMIRPNYFCMGSQNLIYVLILWQTQKKIKNQINRILL